MPYLSTFVYCESSQQEVNPLGQTRLTIINPIQIFRPMFIPSMFSFGIVFGIMELDVSKQHTFRYVFRGPKDEEPLIIDTSEISLPQQPIESDLPEDMRGIMMNLDFRNVAIRNEGIYNSEIFIDGISLGKTPIKVKGRESK